MNQSEAPYDEEHVGYLVATSVALVGRLLVCIRSGVEMHTAIKSLHELR